MDPFTLIATATGIAKATGLDSWLGSLFGGEKGADVAKRVTDMAVLATGAKSPRDALQAIKADSAAMAETRRMLMDNERQLFAMAYADTANARDLQKAALAQDDLFSKRFSYFLAAFWSVIGASFIFCITFFVIPPESVRFADTILGFLLGTIVSQIIQYYFGSSAGSAKKTAMLGGK